MDTGNDMAKIIAVLLSAILVTQLWMIIRGETDRKAAKKAAKEFAEAMTAQFGPPTPPDPGSVLTGTGGEWTTTDMSAYDDFLKGIFGDGESTDEVS